MAWYLWLILFIVVAKVVGMVLRRLGRKSIKGQTIVITGGAMGLGRQFALQSGKRGCNIVLWDINEPALAKTKAELEGMGFTVYTVVCNVTSVDDVKRAAAETIDMAGPVDILVNNAGIVSGKWLLDLTEEHIERTMAVNTTSHFWTIRAFLPNMLKRNKGHIVTIASAAGVSGVPTLMDYVASKFGAFGLAESLRLELRKRGVKGVDSTCVCPYYINTGMFDGVKTRFPLLLPILEEEYVGERVFDAIEHRDYMLFLPGIVTVTFMARFLLPVGVQDAIADFLGISSTMDDFKGRGWNSTVATKAKAH